MKLAHCHENIVLVIVNTDELEFKVNAHQQQ